MDKKRIIVKKFYEENGFVKSNIDSYNSFIEWRMQKIVDSEKELMPAVIPVETEEVKFVFGDISIKKPVITEADGSERPLYPSEGKNEKFNIYSTSYFRSCTFNGW